MRCNNRLNQDWQDFRIFLIFAPSCSSFNPENLDSDNLQTKENTMQIQQQIMLELADIPKPKLYELYDLIHYFK